jgi:hypothetical protein
MNPVETERREFFRITDRLLIEYREIGYQESLVLEKSLKLSDLFPDPHDVNRNPPKNPMLMKNEFYLFLETIDKKLNTVIELLTKRDDLFRSVYLDVNVSGSGLKFTADTKLTGGTYLELRIVLPFFPNPCVTALGKVVRSRLSRAEDKEGWETAVSFVAISEKDRDLLISYVFSREREQLRAKQME